MPQRLRWVGSCESQPLKEGVGCMGRSQSRTQSDSVFDLCRRSPAGRPDVAPLPCVRFSNWLSNNFGRGHRHGGSRSKAAQVMRGNFPETCTELTCILHQASQCPIQTQDALHARSGQHSCRPRERQAHLGRRCPCSHRLNCLLLLILFLLKLLGQFQVTKAQHALWLLLLLQG